MTKQRFLSGAFELIQELNARGIEFEEYTETEYCQECAGAGMGCWCGNGLVEWLVVEYDETVLDSEGLTWPKPYMEVIYQ